MDEAEPILSSTLVIQNRVLGAQHGPFGVGVWEGTGGCEAVLFVQPTTSGSAGSASPVVDVCTHPQLSPP